MAFKHKNLTLGATATRLIAPVTGGTKYPVVQVIIQNTAGNASVYIGGSTVTASDYGHLIAASGVLTLGPFSGSAPMNLTDIYAFGTADQVIHIIYITY